MRRLAIILLVAAAAAGLRLAILDNRPVHHDEANQAVRCGMLLESGRYTYDPADHHGPSLYYLTLPLLRLHGWRSFADTQITAYRLLPALFGIGLVLLPLLMADAIGRGAAFLATLFAAVSPALVYYSRFYIQETLFVFFTAAFLCCVWRLLRDSRLGWGVAAGVCLGMMHATKETFIIAIAAMGGAASITALWYRIWPCGTEVGWWRRCIAAAVIPAALVSALFYSSFGCNPRGILDAVRAYGEHAWRGSAGAQHAAPWYQYLHILAFWRFGNGPIWSEGVILLLAVVGAVILLAGTNRGKARAWGRFLALYALLLLFGLSVIPYKTPWNLLIFLQAFTLLAGVGGAYLARILRSRGMAWLAVLLLCAGLVDLAYQAWRASFVMESDPGNPYVYAQTSRDLVRLVERVEGLAATHKAGKAMRIDVITNPTDAWPLPWYLRTFSGVGYFPPDYFPCAEEGPLPVVIAGLPLGEGLESYLDEGYTGEIRQLRPGTFLYLAVRQDLWEQYLAAK